MDQDHRSAAPGVRPACGAPYPAGAKGAGCPVCLLQGALGPEAANEGGSADERQSQPETGRFGHYAARPTADKGRRNIQPSGFGLVTPAEPLPKKQAASRLMSPSTLAARARRPRAREGKGFLKSPEGSIATLWFLPSVGGEWPSSRPKTPLAGLNDYEADSQPGD
jgi:hypothetical protein